MATMYDVKTMSECNFFALPGDEEHAMFEYLQGRSNPKNCMDGIWAGSVIIKEVITNGLETLSPSKFWNVKR